ncbi:MAG: DUF669 domain-containing protein [Acidobacteriales bacterium]|nr:DUF669 domain-containing protein [Terriglobales bacterium]
MASVPQGFNATTVEPRKFDLIKESDQRLAIVKSERKNTSKGDGSAYLSLEMDVLEGEYKGRKLFKNLNLWNKSDKAREIATQEFAEICLAVGIHQPKDSSELHNLPMTARVVIKKRKDTDVMQNEIKRFYQKDKQPDIAPVADDSPTKPWARS